MCVILCACLLIVLGDVRFIIGSTGYWIVWGAVIFTGLFFSSCVISRNISVDLFVYLTGFLLVFLSFMLSGFANQDVYTIYQGFKIFFIALAFFCIYLNVRDLSEASVYKISVLCIAVGLVLFLMSKYALRDLYVELGDGRQGSQFAYPGVLWKTPVFFIGFVVAGMVFGARSKVVSLFALVGGLFLLKADSSRTGFIILAMVVLLFAVLCAYLRPKTAIICSLLFSLIGMGALILYSGGFVFFSHSEEPLVLNRLAAGDPIRSQMLADGLLHVKQCFPLGCGFGTATSVVDGADMVVHNAYLSSLGDIGMLGFVGITVLIISPICFFIARLTSASSRGIRSTLNIAYSIAAFGGVLGFALLLMLHPFSTELSEWGIWILMVSLLSTFSQRITEVTDDEKVAIKVAI